MPCLVSYTNNKAATELAAQKLAENWKAQNPDDSSDGSSSVIEENLDDSLTSLNWLQNMNINLEHSSESSSSESSVEDQPKATNNDDESNQETSKPQEIDYKVDPNHKPPYSYATLICMAMKESKKSKITLSAIYNWIRENFMYYRLADPSWQNSIRHNLSLNKCFTKVPRKKDEPGKGGFWKIDPAHADMFVDGVFRKRRSCRDNKHGSSKKKNRSSSGVSNGDRESKLKKSSVVLKSSNKILQEAKGNSDESDIKKVKQLTDKASFKKNKISHDGSNHKSKKKGSSNSAKKSKSIKANKHKKKLKNKHKTLNVQRVPESKLDMQSDDNAINDIFKGNIGWDAFFDNDATLSSNSLSPDHSSSENLDPNLFDISISSDLQLSPTVSQINGCDEEFMTEDFMPDILPNDDPGEELMVRGFSCFPTTIGTINDPLLGAEDNQDWQEQQKLGQITLTTADFLNDPWSDVKDDSDLFQGNGDIRSFNSVVLL